MGLGHRAAVHSEVLAEDHDGAAVDGALPGHHAVARVGGLACGHSEVLAPVGDEAVMLSEGITVKEDVEALAGGELAAGVLLVDAGLACCGGGEVVMVVVVLVKWWKGGREERLGERGCDFSFSRFFSSFRGEKGGGRPMTRRDTQQEGKLRRVQSGPAWAAACGPSRLNNSMLSSAVQSGRDACCTMHGASSALHKTGVVVRGSARGGGGRTYRLRRGPSRAGRRAWP